MTTGFNFPAPSDATRVGDWQADTRGGFARMFDGTQRDVGETNIRVAGVQGIDGVIRGRFIWYTTAGESLTCDSAEARELADYCLTVTDVDAVDDPEMAEHAHSVAEALMAAADEIDRLGVGQ